MSTEEKARIIHRLRETFKLKDILSVTGFKKSTYMYWQKRFDRADPDLEIKQRMLAIREEHPNYGCIRMRDELKDHGLLVNKKKIQRLLRVLDIRVTSFTRKSRKYSSYKGTIGKIAPNRVNRRFQSSLPHQKITTDTTEFKYYEMDGSGNLQIKKLYLDPFLDMFNREIVSFSISKRPNGETVIAALDQAIRATHDCEYRRTFHSDQGWAYQMKAYAAKLKEHKIFQSMSHKGNCLDNSPMENFFSILKQEIYYGHVFHSYEDLEEAIVTYMDYYNHKRKKEGLGFKSPVNYRLHYQKQKQEEAV